MASKRGVEDIQIKAPNLQIIKVKIEGTSPLLFHKWSEKAIKMMLDKQMKKAAGGRETRDPDEDYRTSYYYNERDQVAFPTRNIKQAMVGSARFIPGLQMVMLRGVIFVWAAVPTPGKQMVAEEMTPVLVDGKPVTKKDVEKNKDIWMQRDMVTVGIGGTDVRFRGRIPAWTMEFYIQFDADILSAEQVLNLLHRAGFSQGLGEWRAEKNGSNGSFIVASSTEK